MPDDLNLEMLLLALQTPGFGTFGKEASPELPGRMSYVSSIDLEARCPSGCPDVSVLTYGVNWMMYGVNNLWNVCDPDWEGVGKIQTKTSFAHVEVQQKSIIFKSYFQASKNTYSV